MTQYRDSQGSQGTPSNQGQSIDLNLLIGLSWMGEATADQIGRIWFGGYTPAGVRYRLKALKDSGLLTLRYAYERRADTPTPRRMAAGWSLTEAGYALVAEHDPAVRVGGYLPPRHQVLMDHDLFTSEVITRIIELSRPFGLSGLMIARENRIDPRYRRPVIDALIALHYNPKEPAAPHGVPWTKDSPIATARQRRWALENDRGSEALSILAAKAEHYKQVNTLEWRTINGFFPVPLLVTPSQRRMERIFDLWRGVWPAGAWLMTTDDGLQADTWQLYNQGEIYERGLFRGTVAEAEVAGRVLLSATPA